MEDHRDLTAEIDAIVQNSEKKKIAQSDSDFIEISIDKKESDLECIKGKFSLVKETKFLDGSSETETIRSHKFEVKDNELFIENYDQSFSRQTLKIIRDSIMGLCQVARNEYMKMPIDHECVFQCKKKQILVICDSARNIATKSLVKEMLFSGQVHASVIMDEWVDVEMNSEKCRKWAFLELERCAAKGESAVVVGMFMNWYELIPVAVIAAMYGHDLILGRTAGQKLSIGNVLDINVVLEHFMAGPSILRQFNSDPYSAIEYFKQIDGMISSLVIFPSILHTFFSR